MKKRDAILFALPAGAAAFLAVFTAFLYWQISRFEDSYTEETRTTIAQEANLVSAVIRPMLEAGNTAGAIGFCSSFDRDSLRVSLIDASGKVVADSDALPGFLGNHLGREEVRQALAGSPGSSIRYSESLGKWMMYYAVPLKTSGGTEYVLRAAVSTDRISKLINLARLNMIFALLLGGDIVLVLAFYIAKRVRKPLAALQRSVGEIAGGKLGSRIDIPEGGLVRDLAVGVSEMTEQLKRRLAETQLERNEKDALLETMSEGVLLFAPDGTLLRHNSAAAQLFDFARGDRFDLSRCRIPELLSLAHRTLQSGEPFEREFALVRSGATHSMFVKGRVLNSGGDRRLLLTVTELTNLHKLESFRSDFVANVSHEIKTPLTGIIGAAEALEDDESLPPEQRKKMLDILKVQSGRLNNLVHDILSLAELEKQQLAPARNFEPTELDAVVENAVNLCAQHAADAGMTLEVRSSVPLTVEADCQLLEQAVVNLIENAIKYGGGKRIDVSVRQSDGRAVIEVQDYGVGIAPEHQKRIFERFYRVDKSRSRELGGTGLGLAIVKHIAQLHHGAAGVESRPGEGSTFRIELPL